MVAEVGEEQGSFTGAVSTGGVWTISAVEAEGKGEILESRKGEEVPGSMFWQSVEELEAEKKMRKIQSKEEQMVRRGMEALQNIEEARVQNETETKKKQVAKEIEKGKKKSKKRSTEPERKPKEPKKIKAKEPEREEESDKVRGTEVFKMVCGVEEELQQIEMNFEVCDVKRALASVARICSRGNKVVFGALEDEGGSYIENIKSGNRIKMRRKGNAWVVDVNMIGTEKAAEIWVDSAAEESVCPREFGVEFGLSAPEKEIRLVNASGGKIQHFGARRIKVTAAGF